MDYIFLATFMDRHIDDIHRAFFDFNKAVQWCRDMAKNEWNLKDDELVGFGMGSFRYWRLYSNTVDGYNCFVEKIELIK